MRNVIIIPAAQQAQANAAAVHYFDPAGGALTFDVPLFAASAPDDSAPTYYWCSARFKPPEESVLSGLEASFPGSIVRSYDDDNNPDFPKNLILAMGLRTAILKPYAP